MRVLVFENVRSLGERAAKLFLQQLKRKRGSLFGLATGSTPVPMYRVVMESHADFSAAKCVNLDEYVSLSSSHPQSYAHFMQEHLFQGINLPPENAYIPCGTAADLDAECHRYDKLLEKLGRIDLQILGLGRDGHIGFNEPADTLEENTHVVELSESTIEANARFFSSREEVPRRAITMGLRPIFGARKILLLVSGPSKAEILKTVLFGPITPRVPASLLRLHPDVTLLADEEAFGLCRT